MSIITTAHSKLVTLIEGDTSPVYSNVYDYHVVANMTLPALTIDVVNDDIDPIASTGLEAQDEHLIRCSVRVHSCYAGGVYDSAATKDTIDDLIIHLFTRDNRNLSDGYHINSLEAVSFNTEFEDSATVGAELIVIIHKVGNYA